MLNRDYEGQDFCGVAKSLEIVGERWGLNERTAYRRLAEFREVWGPPGLKVGYETPDALADGLIAYFNRRKEALDGQGLMGLIRSAFELPPDAALTTD